MVAVQEPFGYTLEGQNENIGPKDLPHWRFGQSAEQCPRIKMNVKVRLPKTKRRL